MAAFKLPKDTDEQKVQRSAKIQEATFEAAAVPLQTCRKALAVLKLSAIAAAKGNTNAITDAASASAFAAAAIMSAGANVRINLSSLKDANQVSELSQILSNIEVETRNLQTQIREILAASADIQLL